MDETNVALDVDATAALLRAVTGHWSRLHDVGVLCARTRGNPFYLLELARLQEPADVPDAVAELVTHAHCVIVAGLGFGPESLEDPDPMGYRVHQWSPTDSGVTGRSSAIGARKSETPEDGLVWAKHCAEEIGNWGVFLPQLYELYKAVPRGARNPFADLSVERRGGSLRYRRP